MTGRVENVKVGGTIIRNDNRRERTLVGLRAKRIKMQVCGAKQGDLNFIAHHPMILLFVLLILVKLFTEVTLPVAVHFRLVAVDTKYVGNIGFVDLVVDQYPQLAKTLQRERKQQQYG